MGEGYASSLLTQFLSGLHSRNKRWQSGCLYSYSQRLPWRVPRNRISELLEVLRASGLPLFDLTISNPTVALANYPHEQISECYAGVCNFHYDPQPLGNLQARAAIAAEYGKRDISLAPERIALTASTSEAYSLLFKLLCNPGEEVLVPAPSYPLFEFLAKLEYVRVVPYRLVYDGSWYIDFSDLQKQISPAARALVLVNPNNPTGSFLKPSEKIRLMEIAAERSLPVISDEVFMDYAITDASSVRTLLGATDQLTFCFNGLSKMAGMPQLKLGWIALTGPDDSVEDARAKIELLLDTYLSVNIPTQSALPALFKVGDQIRADLLARIKQNLVFLQHAIAGAGIHLLHVEGGWSAILQVPRIMPEETWVERLITEQHVIVQPGYFFDMASEAYLVVSLITEPNTFAEGIRRLLSLLEEVSARC